MKPIIIALLTEVICFVIITFILRLYSIEQRVSAMLKIFLALFPVLLLIHLLIPSDLGILPKWMITSNNWVDLIFSIFLYISGFFGGILQLYNLSDRGFSLRILIDIYENPKGCMSVDDIMTDYSHGNGIDWMYKKRIIGMVSTGLVNCSNGIVKNTKKGKKTAKICNFLRTFYRLPNLKNRK